MFPLVPPWSSVLSWPWSYPKRLSNAVAHLSKQGQGTTTTDTSSHGMESSLNTQSPQCYWHPLLSRLLHTEARATALPHALAHVFTHTHHDEPTHVQTPAYIAWNMRPSTTSSTPVPTDSPLCQLCMGRICVLRVAFLGCDGVVKPTTHQPQHNIDKVHDMLETR